MTKVRLALISAGLALVVTPLRSQTSPEKKPSFDVISVKLNRSGGPPNRIGTEANRFIAENVPVIVLIVYAYRSEVPGLFRSDVIGGPSWISTDRFDVEAKLEGNIRAIPTMQTWLMVRTLLEDRF